MSNADETKIDCIRRVLITLIFLVIIWCIASSVVKDDTSGVVPTPNNQVINTTQQ